MPWPRRSAGSPVIGPRASSRRRLLFRSISEFDDVRKTRSRGDGGIDVVAVNKKEFTSGRVAIQAKCYAPGHKVPVAKSGK